MGKLLKVLTVIVLLLSIGAFVMGLSNFSKRELLIGRTHALEEKIIQISMTLEDKEPVFDGVASHTERDIDEVTARPLEIPNKSDFWSGYNDSMEIIGTPTIRLDNEASRMQLRTYYLLDPMGKVVKDIQKRPKTQGTGTMDELLTGVLDKAGAQLKRLNATRAQLAVVRQELETVIDALNTEKKERRVNLRTIAELTQKIGDLEAKIEGLNADIARLEREKAELNDTILELNDKIAKKDEELVALGAQVARLEEKVKILTVTGPLNPSGGKGGTAPTLTPGVKGTIAHVDPNWAFVLVKLTPEAVSEITGGEGFAPVEMMVHRKTAAGDAIVTRLRIGNPPNKDNLVIADNMYGWEQMPLEVGDNVIY